MIIQQIEQKIIEKLNEIDELVEVFDYYNTVFDGFPYAGVELVEMKWQKLNTIQNVRTWNFWILIFQETSIMQRENAKNLLYIIANKIITAFDTDWTLWGLAKNSTVTEISINDWMNDKKWKGLYLAVTLNIDTILNIL